MTKEEIINGLKFTVDLALLDTNTGETLTKPRNDMDKLTIDACKGAIDLLEQEPKAGWISVKERLPKKTGRYLVTMKEKANTKDLDFLNYIKVKIMIVMYNEGWKYPTHIPEWVNEVITDEVIAWQPLPKPYSEREE